MFNKSQIGRSMIEMLGVLAIISVLSVGGLAGYARAMRTIKLNDSLAYFNQVKMEIKTREISGTMATSGGAKHKCTDLTGVNLPRGISKCQYNDSRDTYFPSRLFVLFESSDLMKEFIKKITLPVYNVSPKYTEEQLASGTVSLSFLPNQNEAAYYVYGGYAD